MAWLPNVMKLPSQFTFITLLAAAAAWVCGVGGWEKRGVVLRVGITPAPGYELNFLAEEKGFFREEGLEVRLVEFTCLADCRRAFARGQVDVLGSTAVEVAGSGERTAEVAKFLRALSRAVAYTKQNQADACRIMARRTRPLLNDVSEAATRGVGVPIQAAPESAPGARPVTFMEPADASRHGEIRADAADRPAAINLALWQTKALP